MRIPSGVTDQYIYFTGVDSTDLKTRETGLSSFTVYRSRNGAAAAAMTTPTINETDSSNMPGVYELLLDEDMTIGSGNDSEEMCFHITHAGMAPVTRVIELYRPKITAGYTLGVESDGDLTKVNTLDGHTAQTGDSYARLGAPNGASVSADIGTAQADLDIITGGDGAILNSTQANYAPATATAMATAQADLDTITGADGVAFASADVAALVDDIWDEATSGHTTAGTTGKALTDAGSAGDPWSTALPGAYGAGTAGHIVGNQLDAAVSSRSSHDAAAVVTAMGTGTFLSAVPWNDAWDTEVVRPMANGTAVAGASNSIQLDAGGTFLDDELNGATIDIIDGTGAGQSRRITDFTLMNQQATVDALWTTTPDATSKYQVVSKVPIEPDEAADVYSYFTSGSNEDAFKADVSALATQTSVDTIDGIVDAILVDTAEIGTAGAGLTEAGGTGDHLTDVGGLSTAALAEFATVDTGESTAANGSVAKIAQGAAGGNVTVGDITTAALAKFATEDTGETSSASGSVATLSQGAGGGGGGVDEDTLAKYVGLIMRSDSAIWADLTTESGKINTDHGSGSGDAGNQDTQEAIRDALRLLAVAGVQVTEVDQTQQDVTVVQGDDYFYVDETANFSIEWESATDDEWPDLTGATLKIAVRDDLIDTSAWVPTVVTATGSQKVRLEITSSQSGVQSGVYRYDLQATLAGALDGKVHTLRYGDLTIKKTYTDTP